MSFIEKSTDDIHKEMLDAVSDEYQKTIGFPAWDFLRAVAIGFKLLWDLLSKVLSKHDVNNMEGKELRDYISQHRNIQWKEGTYASGYLTFEGDFEVEKGEIIQNSSGLNYEIQETVKSVNKSARVYAKCQTKGSIGNCGAHSIKIMPAVIPGVVSVTNEEPFSNGYDDETDEELRERYFEDLKAPLTSGNKYHYKKWAKDVKGVGDAKVFPLWDGDNTVKVLLIDSNKKPADIELVNAVQKYIDPFELQEDGIKKGWGTGMGQAPIGAYCTIESAEPLYIDVSLTAKKTAVSEETIIKTDIGYEIEKYLKSIAFKDETDSVSYAQTGGAVLRVSGLIDYSDLFINGAKTNIEVKETQTPVLRDLTVTFEE